MRVHEHHFAHPGPVAFAEGTGGAGRGGGGRPGGPMSFPRPTGTSEPQPWGPQFPKASNTMAEVKMGRTAFKGQGQLGADPYDAPSPYLVAAE